MAMAGKPRRRAPVEFKEAATEAARQLLEQKATLGAGTSQKPEHAKKPALTEGPAGDSKNPDKAKWTDEVAEEAMRDLLEGLPQSARAFVEANYGNKW